MTEMKLCTYASIYSCEELRPDIAIVGPRDPEETKKHLGESDYGFSFFDILEGTVVLDGKEIKIQSEQLNQSPCYFPGGRIYSQKEMESALKKDQNTVLVLKDIAGMMKTDKFCRTRLDGCTYLSEDIWRPVENGEYIIIDE